MRNLLGSTIAIGVLATSVVATPVVAMTAQAASSGHIVFSRVAPAPRKVKPVHHVRRVHWYWWGPW
jgi:hypothetical protein